MESSLKENAKFTTIAVTPDVFRSILLLKSAWGMKTYNDVIKKSLEPHMVDRIKVLVDDTNINDIKTEGENVS